MDLIKYDMTDIWAVAGDVVAPDSAKIRAGWGVEVVPRQWWNWFENRQDNNLAYMLQKGFPEWDATTEYIINKSYVQRSGVVYRATATSTNSDPVALLNWVKAFPESTPYLEAIKSLPVVNNTQAYIDGSGVAQNAASSAFGRQIGNVADASAARTLISAQVAHANLTGLSSVSGDANNLPYFTGSGNMAVTAFTGFARSLLDDSNATAARLTLGLDQVDNTSDVNKPISSATSTALAGKQPLDATLTALAGVVNSANTFPYFTGVDTATTTALTSYARSLLDDADATTARSTLGLGTAATQTITTSTTDDTTGRLLKVGDFGLGDNVVELAGVDVLTLSRPTGFYQFTSTCTNLPVAGIGFQAMVVRRTTSSEVLIIGAVNDSSGAIYTNRYSQSAWVGWKKPLNVGDYGLGTTDLPDYTGDLNSLNATGFYMAAGAATNMPSGETSGFVTVKANGSGNISQQYDTQGLNRSYERACNAGTWSAWRLRYNQVTAVGTVSQSSGTPTGAIIETGSNAQGRYVRYADGTQIAWTTVGTNSPGTYAVGALFGSDAYAPGSGGGYPASFVALPNISASATRGSSAAGVFPACYTPATASVWGSWRVLSVDNTAVAGIIYLTAVGRWF